MKSPTRALRGARKLGNAIRAAGRNARKTGELTKATGHVVATRMALGAKAVKAAIDPRKADHAEFATMIPEKAKAFSEAGMTVLQWSSEVAGRTARFAASEMASAAEAAAAMANCKTPADFIATQGRLATAWLGRAMSQSIALGSLAMRSQGGAMAPIHRTATANAQRPSR
jgi:hypothetical protein